MRNFIASLLVGTLCLASIQAQTTSTLCPDGKPCVEYEVQKHESLYGISKKFNLTQQQLLDANPELQKNGLKAGQKIFIPVVSKPSSVFNPTVLTLPESYTVKKGDTFYSIQKQFKLTRQEILDLNPGIDPDNMKEGTVLRLKKNLEGTVKQVIEQFKNKQTSPTSTVPGIEISAPTTTLFSVKKEYTLAVLLPTQQDRALLQAPADWEKKIPFPDEAAVVADFSYGLEYGIQEVKPNVKIILQYIQEDAADSLFEPYWKKYTHTCRPDAVIGPFYADHVRKITDWTRPNFIPLISPWILHNKFLYDNPLALKFNTSQQTMAENLAAYISDSLTTSKYKLVCFLASVKDLKEQAYYRLFRQAFLKKQESHGRRDTLITARSLSELKNIINSHEKIALVTLNQNKVLMTDFLTQLYLMGQKKDIVLCGMKSLLDFENIDQEYLNLFRFTFPSFTCFSSQPDSVFTEKYRNIFRTVPGEFARLGRSLGKFLAQALSDKGLNFILEKEIYMKDDFLPLYFIRPDSNTGLDNVGNYIYRFCDFQFIQTGWK